MHFPIGRICLPWHTVPTQERTRDRAVRRKCVAVGFITFSKVSTVAAAFHIPELWRHQAWPVGLFLGAIVACILLLRLSAWSRERNLRRKRAGLTQESFTAWLQQYGFDPVITSSTYRYLQEVQLVSYPILPGDKLDEDLGLDTDEINQVVRDLTIALRREFSPGLRPTPLVTVEDLIRLLQASPRIVAPVQPRRA